MITVQLDKTQKLLRQLLEAKHSTKSEQLSPDQLQLFIVAFLAYCVSVTLKHRLTGHAPGLTPRAVLEKLAAIQMLDVSFPTTDGRRLVMPRHTEPEPEQAILLHQLGLVLPQQPPPRITTGAVAAFPQLKM